MHQDVRLWRHGLIFQGSYNHQSLKNTLVHHPAGPPACSIYRCVSRTLVLEHSPTTFQQDPLIFPDSRDNLVLYSLSLALLPRLEYFSLLASSSSIPTSPIQQHSGSTAKHPGIMPCQDLSHGRVNNHKTKSPTQNNRDSTELRSHGSASVKLGHVACTVLGVGSNSVSLNLIS